MRRGFKKNMAARVKDLLNEAVEEAEQRLTRIGRSWPYCQCASVQKYQPRETYGVPMRPRAAILAVELRCGYIIKLTNEQGVMYKNEDPRYLVYGRDGQTWRGVGPVEYRNEPAKSVTVRAYYYCSFGYHSDKRLPTVAVSVSA